MIDTFPTSVDSLVDTPLRIKVVIIAGVAGVGKTKVGRCLAKNLGWGFSEGDDFHPSENLNKLKAGVPLTDEDRWPWLERLKGLIEAAIREDLPTIVTCSLLKESYRRFLLDGFDSVRAVFLTAPDHLVAERIDRRGPHLFPKELLQSQFETWEEPKLGIVVDASQAPAEIVAEIKKRLLLAE
ncbi:MAG: gluconokinase, GntK/IdnK-type [Acidobacteriota bacterium]